MSLVFASICPHPPLLIPQISKESIKEVEKTKKAMEKLAFSFQKANPEIVIIISPHGPVFAEAMSIKGLSYYTGNFGLFGAPQVQLQFKGDELISEMLASWANKNNIPTILLDEEKFAYGIDRQLDHGTLVPLYYLTNNGKFSDFILIPISFSFLSLEDHFMFGQILAKSKIFESHRIAIVASGDLSHVLTYDAPAGYNPIGKEFDETLIKLIKEKNIEGIINLDGDFIEEAAECGLRSIIILLGALSQYQWSPEILSYEGPFGVGYLVANFKLNA